MFIDFESVRNLSGTPLGQTFLAFEYIETANSYVQSGRRHFKKESMYTKKDILLSIENFGET